MTQSISDAEPNGFCKACGRPLIKENGVNTCVNCKVYSEPSGLVNEEADPGHNAMSSQPGVRGGEVKPIGPEEDKSKTQPIKIPKVPADARLPEVPDDLKPNDNGVEACMNYIRKYFSNVPVKNMAHAKKLFKLQKDIDALATKITTFLEEN